MKRRYAWPAILAALALLSACAAVRPPVPKTPSQALAVAEVEYSALKLSAAELADTGVLTGVRLALVESYFEKGDEARRLARAAWDAGDMTALDGQLAALHVVLLELRKEVAR